MLTLLNARVNDDLDSVRECMDYHDKCMCNGDYKGAGMGAAAARDGCQAISTRIGGLANALDKGEYHNDRLQWLRRLELHAQRLQLALAVRVMQIESAISREAEQSEQSI